MEQRTSLYPDPIRVYVTIGCYTPQQNRDVVHAERQLVTIGKFPDTVVEASLRLREEVAQKLTNNRIVLSPISPELLYFMVYRTCDPDEKPYLFSDNSPANFTRLNKIREKLRRDRMTIFQRVREDLGKFCKGVRDEFKVNLT